LKEYEKDRESMAMLKLLAMGRKDMLEGRHKPMRQAFAKLKKKIRSAEKSGSMKSALIILHRKIFMQFTAMLQSMITMKRQSICSTIFRKQ